MYDLVIAKETASKTRIQAISVFARMHSSVLVALKAYETGKAVILSMPEKEVVVATLEALSKLALKSSIIVPLQADLLLSHICSDPHTVVRAISLKCLSKLAMKATGRLGIEEKAVEVLLSIFENAAQPPIIKDLTLRLLKELLPFCLVAFDASHLVRLLSVEELSASRPILSQVQPVLGFLVDLVCCVGKSRPDVLEAADAQMSLETQVLPVLSGNNEPIYGLDISTRIAVLVCDQVALLGCENSSEGFNLDSTRDIPQGWNMIGGTELRKRCLFFGGLLLQLAQYSSHCSFVVVDRLSGMVEALLTKVQQLQEPSIIVVTETRDQDIGNLHAVSAEKSYLLRMMCRCIRNCGLIWLSEEGHSSKILFRLTKLVTFIMTAVVSHHILKDLLLLLLKVRGFLSFQQAQAIAIKVNDAVVSFVKEEDYWSAYKVMTLAACHGLWNISSEAIGHIVQKARSGSAYFWLKTLASVCTFEGILQDECESLNHANTVASEGCYESLVDMETNVLTHSNMSGNLGKAIARALSGVYLAENSLAAAVKLERTFEFQRRLLNLRITFVRTSGELLGLLGPICVDFKSSDVQLVSNTMAPIDNDIRKPSSSSIQAVASKSGLFCTKFNKLAAAFDVLRVSCMGIDEESANMLSFASLGCSFVSFCILCSLSVPQILGSGSALNPSMQCLAASVSNDLYQRLDAVGGDECSDLLNYILQLGGANETAIIGGAGFCVYNLEKEVYKFISWAVTEVLGLQEDMNLRNPELSWLVLARGMHVCKKVVEKWLCLPWALPKHFLCTRLPVCMDVFVELMIDSQKGKEKLIKQGLLAPLSICFQIRNLDINGGKKVKRLCSAVMLNSGKMGSGEPYTGWNLNEMTVCSDSELFLLEKLFKEVSVSKEMMWEESNQHGNHGQVRNSPPTVLCGVNEKGQGFASCLLDTSGLKCGVFHVSVLAVCLDKDHRCWIVPPVGDGPTVRIVPSTSG